jgi:hypothetical protein
VSRIKASEVLQPKSKFDRTLANLERMRIWEHTPAAVDLDVQIVREAIALSQEEKCPRSIKLRALSLAHKIVKETFIDRTIPTVHRVGALDALAALPLADGEREANPVTSEEQARAESIALLRGVLARLESMAPGANAARPGLVLLREGDRAAG